MRYELLLATSLLSFAIYSFFLLNFCTKILHKGNKNPIILGVVSIVNTAGLAPYLLLDFPIYSHYLLLFILLIIEFKLLSKAGFRQILFATCAISMHVITSHTLIYFGIGFYFSQNTYTIYADTYLRTMSIFLLAIVLAILLLSLKRFIPIKDTYRVSTSKIYSHVVSAFSFSASAAFLLSSFFLFSHVVTINIFLFCFFSVLVVVVMFYYTFLYVIQFLNLSIFKRESDKIESQYKNILEQKEIIVNKVVRDSLTGLYNKKFIENTLETLCSEENIPGFALFFADINSLKKVNDTYGHHKGDELIRAVANAISSSTRDTDFAARISGDEFIIISPNMSEIDSIYLKDRIKNNIEEENKRKEFLVSAGLGMVYVDSTLRARGCAYLLDLADTYMRNDKKSYYMKEHGNL